MPLPFVVRHLRHKNGQPYGTLAYTTRTGNPHTYRFALAICRDGDQFVKRIGRDKAVGRLNSKKSYYTGTSSHLDFTEVDTETLLQHIFFTIKYQLPLVNLDMWKYDHELPDAIGSDWYEDEIDLEG